jgi:tetratricopeptide (TPR) repeat protein
MQTSLDDEAMRAWAAAGGGHYVGIEDAHAYARIASLCEEAARSTGTRRNVRVETDVSPALALVALGFLGLALLLSGPQSTRKTSEEGHRPSVTRRGLTRGSTAMLNIIVVISISFFLSSCVEIEAFTTLRANRLYRSGFIHEAAAAYLKAGAGENPIASYNMANFFILQGEREPAMEMFESAIASGQTELVARSWYNIGIALYTEADYEGSLSSFRKALEAYIDTSEPIHKRSNPRNEERRRQMARAYELALRAQAERRDAGATERGRYGAGSALGELRPFALSRTDEKTLFAPGESASSVMEDQ